MFSVVLDAINAALDAITDLPDEAHGRETGQVEYKLNEAKLWLGVVPGAIEALSKDAADAAKTAAGDVKAAVETVHTEEAAATAPAPVSATQAAPAAGEALTATTTKTDAAEGQPTPAERVGAASTDDLPIT